MKIKKKIKSSTLILKNLDKFKGRDVEILIISESNEAESDTSEKKTKGKKAAGILEKFKNPKVISKEKLAWELAVRGKYANS